MGNSSEPTLKNTESIPPEMQYRALLNILEDLQQEKEELLNQRKATSNLLEDLEEEKKSVEKKVVLRTQELAKEKAKTETLLKSIGDGVIAIDVASHIIFINSPAVEMLGLERQEAVGKSWFDIINVTDEKGNKVSYKDLPIYNALLGTTTTTTTTTTTYLTRIDGSIFPASVTAAPVLNEKTEGVIVVFRDITREKEIDRAKSEFVSLAAHQLNTPLIAMAGYTEMVLDEDSGKISEKQKEYLGEVYTATQRMIELVRSLLNVSRIELGVFAIEPEPTNIVELAEIALGELSAQIKKKKQKIIENLDKTLPAVSVDRILMGMIFQNLLSNAVKYTPPEGRITLIVKKEEPNVLISVADTGYGIPKDAQVKIFTKLFRADNIRETVPSGTGLGLYIIKSVVETAGGKIWFESPPAESLAKAGEENKGTIFFVTFPLSGMKKRAGTKGLR